MWTRSAFTACLLAGAALSIAAPQASGATSRPEAKASAWHAPRTAFGSPDLQGTWSNVTITPLERPASFGTRTVLTPDEVRTMEGRAIDKVNYENQPTDPKIGAVDTTNKNCNSVSAGGTGAGGRDCGYNAGWKDSTVSVMRVNGEPRTSFITSTSNGRIPPVIPKPASAARAAQAQREAEQAAGENAVQRPGANDNPENRPLAERCLAFGNTAGPLMPNGYYNNNIRLVQSKDSVAIWLEMVHDVRIVRIGGAHRTDGIRPWFGDSVGHWEGETLVVSTNSYHPGTSFHGSDDNLELTERFTRVGQNRLLYQFTIHDPTVWATDWGGEYEFYPTQGGGLYEYACHEANYGLEDVLAGARNQENEARRTAAPRAAR